jgi:hypothetical protein
MTEPYIPPTAPYNFLFEVAPQVDFELEARLYRDGVPPSLHDGLLRYLRRGILPGGFLTAVLQGDLYKAAITADAGNFEAIGTIARALVWALPADAYGSPAKVARWAHAAQTKDVAALL